MRTSRVPFPRGATLVETAAALAVVAIVAAQAAPSLQGLIAQRRLDGAATLLAADLQAARVEAITRNRPVRLALDTARGCWLLHTGPAGACSCSADGQAACAPGSQALRVQGLPAGDGLALVANVASIAFDPVLGTATPAATLRVAQAHGGEIRHTVNLLGRTRSCAADVAIAGWRAC